MKTGELSTGTPSVSPCCKADEWWRDCDLHKEECFATYCKQCTKITFRGCTEGGIK